MFRRAAALALALALLPACSASDVPLTSRPTGPDSARDLARAVADAASCDGFEDFAQHRDHWDFTCGDVDHSFTIRVVASRQARLQAVAGLAASGSPVKAGDYFLVQEDLDYGSSKAGPPRPNPVSDLNRFPGRVVRPAG